MCRVLFLTLSTVFIAAISSARADDRSRCRDGIARLRTQIAQRQATADNDELQRTLRRVGVMGPCSRVTSAIRLECQPQSPESASASE